jgi:hypothetical protein
MTERELRRKPPEFHEQLAQRRTISDGALQASSLIDGLLAESGVLGQCLGYPRPVSVHRSVGFDEPMLPSVAADWDVTATDGRDMCGVRWEVFQLATAEPIRIGAVVFDWQQFDILPVRPLPSGIAFYPEDRWGRDLSTYPETYSHVVDAKVKVRVEVDPPLPRGLHVYVRPSLTLKNRSLPTSLRPGPDSSGAWREAFVDGQWRKTFTPHHDRFRTDPAPLPSGERTSGPLRAGEDSCEIAATLILPADPDGRVAADVEAGAGPFVLFRPRERRTVRKRDLRRAK